jgi:hypothetical protein
MLVAATFLYPSLDSLPAYNSESYASTVWDGDCPTLGSTKLGPVLYESLSSAAPEDEGEVRQQKKGKR